MKPPSLFLVGAAVVMLGGCQTINKSMDRVASVISTDSSSRPTPIERAGAQIAQAIIGAAIIRAIFNK